MRAYKQEKTKLSFTNQLCYNLVTCRKWLIVLFISTCLFYISSAQQSCTGYDVVYDELNNVNNSGTRIERDINAQASFTSKNVIPASEDGYMCFKVNNTNSLSLYGKAIGLSSSSSGVGYQTIDYGFYIPYFKNSIQVIYYNRVVAEFKVSSGGVDDVLKIERQEYYIIFYHNDRIVYMQDTSNNRSLIVDGWFSAGEDQYSDISLFFKDVKISHEYVEPCELSLSTKNTIELCTSDEQIVGVSGANYYRWSPSTGLSCDDCPTPTISNRYGIIAFNYEIKGYDSEEVYSAGKDNCSEITLSVLIKTNCEDPIIGCCFSNYGAVVTVNPDTYLNIHCNLINEVGFDENDNLTKGEFENNGYIRVEKEWINNGYNELFITQTGVSELFGAYQRIRGNSPTHFFDLILSGNGIKEQRIDEYALNTLNLTVNELSANDFIFYMENSNPNAIQRQSGFVSTNGIGYLSRQIQPNQSYSYPLGATSPVFRYRPYDIYNSAANDQYKIAFVNHDPIIDELDAIAPNVLSINEYFYHKIQAPQDNNTIGIRAYYNQLTDGNFQSLAHWESDPPSLWESTPLASVFSNYPSSLDYLETYGSHDFTGEPFVLAQAGFYINTDDFGNDEEGNSGTTIVINPINNNNSNGGGLGNPNGTGGNTTIAPNNPPGDYEIDISTEEETQDGNIIFTIDNDGTIDTTSIVFEDEESGTTGILSPDLYDIDTLNNGIVLTDTPPSLEVDCSNSISISMGVDNPLYLDIPLGESIIVNGIPTNIVSISSLDFRILDRTGTSVFNSSPTVNSNFTIAPSDLSSLSSGAYHFELDITLSSGNQETINGQFILNQ